MVQLTWSSLSGGTVSGQADENVPAGATETVGIKQVLDCGIEIRGQAADSGDDLERRRIELGTLCSPFGAHVVDMVAPIFFSCSFL